MMSAKKFAQVVSNLIQGGAFLCGVTLIQGCFQQPNQSLPSRIFITSASYTPGVGVFMGIAGADAECSKRAEEGGLTGSYIAFLSDSNTHAIERINSNGPFYMKDGVTLLFQNKEEFFTANVPDIQNELGVVENAKAWTGTLETGQYAGQYAGASCQNWTSSTDPTSVNVGDQEGVVQKWISEGPKPCSDSYRLYCITKF